MQSSSNSTKKISLKVPEIPKANMMDLPGVGPALAKKLQETGFKTLESIATVSIGELVALGGLGEKTAGKIIQAARDKLGYGFITADVILESRRNMLRATTGADALDDLLNGGIETGSITELYGEYRTGKTQLAHQLCVTCQLPPALGGFNINDQDPITCVYIDTEGTFRPERIVAMASRFGNDLDVQTVLKHIFHGRAYNSDHQMVLAENLIKDAPSNNIKLVIVDSLIAHFRAEFVGRGTLAARQQKLNQHLHSLLKLAEVSNVAVIVTNQVHSQPDMYFGDPTMPVGGHILAHVSHTRIYLRKSKGERRIARIVDSPLLPESETVFAITEEGINDIS
ncbi:MAG: DNA repair and recombination protein RadA [Candidatus Heimdallarchaeota archaeon]|nr:MAG: DNA repair and recombination protein RadA [Candidatus Heimdallarchaeota archaeon]